MVETRAAIFSALVMPAKDMADGGVWQLVLPAGSTRARDGRGPFLAGDRAAMAKIVERTLARLGETELLVDYEHQSFQNYRADRAPVAARAAGWVKKLEARADGIHALIEWTQPARAAIRAGEWRYLSPVFTHDDELNVGELLSLALVNQPAFDLKAAAAFVHPPLPLQEKTDMTISEKLLAALGLKAGADEAAALAAVAALKGEAKTAGATALKAVALAAKLPEAATGEEIAARVAENVAALAAKGDGGSTAIAALKAELAATATALAETRKSIAAEKAEAFIDGAIAEGRVGVKALRDHYIARFAASAQGAADVKTEIGKLPAIAGETFAHLAQAPGQDGKVALSAAHKAAAAALGIAEADYSKQLEKEAR